MADDDSDKQVIERGRYFVSIAVCNDCHSPGYPQSCGNIPQSEWLTGNSVGYNRPKNTTKPTKKHQHTQTHTTKKKHKQTQKKKHPPKPKNTQHNKKENDKRAV